MKNQLLLSSLLIGTAISAGCKPSAERAALPSPALVLEPVDQPLAPTPVAAKALQDYPFAQKAQFVAGMRAQLSELNRTVQELSAKVEGASDGIKQEGRPKITALRVQAEQLKLQLDVAQNATETSWIGAKADSQKIYGAMQDGIAQARQWLAEKTAP